MPHPLANNHLCASKSMRMPKLEAAEALMELHLDKGFSAALVQDNPAADVSPIILKHKMFSAARLNRQHIVLPEGDDIRIVTAAAELLARGLCDVTLLGDPVAVNKLAEKAHVVIDGAEIIDPLSVLKPVITGKEKTLNLSTSLAPVEPVPWAEELVDGLYEARKKKGMTHAQARELLRLDCAYFGTMMMLNGMADGMVSGACHSTANTMRPALQLIKMAPGFKIASSVFFMLLRDKVRCCSQRTAGCSV